MRRDDAKNTFLEGLQDQRKEDNQEEPVPPYAPVDIEIRTVHSNAWLPKSTEESAGGSMPLLVMSLPEAKLKSASGVIPSTASMSEVTTSHSNYSTIAARCS